MSRRTRDAKLGLRFLSPPGWRLTQAPWGHVLEAVLQPEPDVSHVGRINVLAPQHHEGDASSSFSLSWRQLLGALRQQATEVTASDVVAWYWGHLPCGMSIRWMGRDFYDPDPSRNVYAALYSVSLPDGATQSITATVVPRGGRPTLAMDLVTSARLALGGAMSALLGSVQAPGPIMAQALVSVEDVTGRWISRMGHGGLDVVHAHTGLYAGQQGVGHTVQHEFARDGRYAYRFTQFNMPSGGLVPVHQTDAHEGVWKLEGDVIHRQPSRPMNRDNRLLVAGAGVRADGGSARQVLILIPPQDGKLVRPGIVPDHDQLSLWGPRAWWCEEDASA